MILRTRPVPSLLRNMSWLALVTGVERLAAIAQTVLIARAIGMTDYGVYGLLFGFVGLLASTAGMQMGLTATVFLARFRDGEKAKAASVIRFSNRFAHVTALGLLLVVLPNAGGLAAWLVGPGREAAVLAACLLVALSIVGGVQDGIVQGFEDFRTVAFARLGTTVVTLAFVYPAGVAYGLWGVLATVVVGQAVKYALLSAYVRHRVRSDGLTLDGPGVPARQLLFGFSLPSMLVSLLSGAVGWSGAFVLSRQAGGFAALAIANTGIQWRGPIFLIASIASTVAIPAISRHHQRLNEPAISRIQRGTTLFNGGFAVVASLGLIALSGPILSLYGPDFAGGGLVFSFLVASSVPQVIAGVYLQQIAARGWMWQQLALHVWLVVPLAAGYAVLVPALGGLGFAITNLAAWSLFAVVLAVRWNLASQVAAREAIA